MIESTHLRPDGTYRVRCGWCAAIAEPPICANCGNDPELRWHQLGREAPSVEQSGRPPLDAGAVRVAYLRAERELREQGREPTVEAIAERLDRSPRTVREWRKRYGL